MTAVKGYTCEVVTPKSGSKIVFVKSDYIGGWGGCNKAYQRIFVGNGSHNPKTVQNHLRKQRVALTTKEKNNDVINSLKELEKCGVTILSCGTCLEFYGLASELKVGTAGNALDTVESLLSSNSVVSL